MRLKLHLRPIETKTIVPINYQYPLSAAIYKILGQAAPEYASWLHDQGYRSPKDRLLKLFTFSRLNIPRVIRINNTLISKDRIPWLLQIASPMQEEFVQNFVLGLFQDQQMEIGGVGAVGRFIIETVESLSIPEFSDQMKGMTVSPIVAATVHEINGQRKRYFYRPTDAELPEALRKNIIDKYITVTGNQPENTQFEIQFDMDYFKRRNGKVTKKIQIKEGTEEETEIISFEMPFTLTANPELIRTAWECGLGEHTSQGFGMVEVW